MVAPTKDLTFQDALVKIFKFKFNFKTLTFEDALVLNFEISQNGSLLELENDFILKVFERYKIDSWLFDN